jgi:hypothetical protein
VSSPEHEAVPDTAKRRDRRDTLLAITLALLILAAATPLALYLLRPR